MITKKDIIEAGFKERKKHKITHFYTPRFVIKCRTSLIAISRPNEENSFQIVFFPTLDGNKIAMDEEAFSPQTIFNGYIETVEELKTIIKCLRFERFK